MNAEPVSPPIPDKFWDAAHKMAWKVAVENAPVFAAMKWTWGAKEGEYVPSANDVAKVLRRLLASLREFPTHGRCIQTGRLFAELLLTAEGWRVSMGLLNAKGLDEDTL